MCRSVVGNKKMIQIRRFTETDAQAVSELIIKTLLTTNTKDYPVEEMEELAQKQQPLNVFERASWTHYYVVEAENIIIGCGAIGPYWGKEDESSLFSIFVHPDYQGCGIGRMIMETLEKDPYFLRAKRVEIPASITGLNFYLKMGYDFKNGNKELDDEHLYRLEKVRGQNIMNSFDELKETVRRLRAEDGCPWDREQTHGSLKAPVIEEAAEVICGVNIFEQTGNPENLKEELGDLMLQVVMQAQIAEEEGIFTLDDVIRGITEKMIRRHPHVFGNAKVKDSGEVLANWEEIKKQEKIGKEDDRSFLGEAFDEAEDLIGRARRRKGL